MNEYAALGIDTFILSGYPHLEEAYRFAESVFPRLPLRRQANPQELPPASRQHILARTGPIRLREGARRIAPKPLAFRRRPADSPL